MQLDIVSPDNNIFSGQVEYVQLPGTEGSFGILDNHAPMIATLQKGTITVRNEAKEEQEFDIKGGVVEVLKNKVIVLAE